ncbi:hypothetical protein NIES4071_06820 [Calothrix sp. NIES-4071]|nr:hypothetical protein NIES4071_06820 [Calothrix sp. NIES-4071]BAZ55024.1 hypothetical protein NIES4105_06780 [Calothrix sp. NIES-4105]
MIASGLDGSRRLNFGLYILGYDADGILNSSDAGALIYLSPDGKTRTTLALDKRINPTS